MRLNPFLRVPTTSHQLQLVNVEGGIGDADRGDDFGAEAEPEIRVGGGTDEHKVGSALRTSAPRDGSSRNVLAIDLVKHRLVL